MSKGAIYGGLLGLLITGAAGCGSDDSLRGAISVSPAKVNVRAGSDPVIFTATVPADAGRITWSLEGPGALSARGDTAVAYTPPATVPVSTPCVLSATIASAGRGTTADIQIVPRDAAVDLPDGGDPRPQDVTLRVSPASISRYAGGGAIDFTAAISGGSGEVTWSLVGPGSLSFSTPLTARYLPPPSIEADTTAVLTAHLSSPPRTARATILVQRPVGNLAIHLVIPAGIGLRPNVSLIGPGGFSRSLSTSEILSGLIPGSYRASGSPELWPGPIVSAVYLPGISGSPAQVAAGGTATIDIAYSARRGSGHLWVVDAGSARLRAYGGGSLSGPGRVSAEIVIGSGESGFATSGALATDGDICVLVDPFTIARYSSGRLESGATPDLVLGSGREGGWLNFVSGLAFDPSGNLWLTSNAPSGPTDRRILKFAASRLRLSDPNPTPEVTIRGYSSWYSSALAFDRAGNLWVADFVNDRLVKFSPSQLLTDGSPAPSTTLSNVGPGNPLNHPIDLAFDADGNLWASNLGSEQPSELVMYTATQALAGGSPNPAIRIARPTLGGSRGLAFDAGGGLWMAVPGALARFSRSQLFGGGAPTPQIVQDGSLMMPAALIFDPPPSAIPLYR